MDTLRIQRRNRLRAIQREAEGLAQTSARIAGACAQAEALSERLDIQPQVQFLVGALARVQKDWGVVEHLQALEAERVRPKPR